MGWETRNGNRYYYQKRREGARVVSVYCGSGFQAELTAQGDELAIEQHQAEQLIARELRAQHRELSTQLAQLDDYTQTLTRAALLLAGYHPHKGQWRRARLKNSRKSP